MENKINGLLDEHKRISEEISAIETIFHSYSSQREFLRRFKSLQDFTVGEHHRNEEKEVFGMLASSKKSDKDVIDHFLKEHQLLEKLHAKIIKNLESSVNMQEDIQDFLELYKEHIQKEEKFIFLIADKAMKKEAV